MATADEVLKEMDNVSETNNDSPVCVIDPETRTITVPPEYQLLGVENDKRVERIYFQCPKIVGDNQDLSQDYQLFINYQNANGDPDACHIDDMEVDGDNITFSWILEENVTKYKGSIQIAFAAIIPGDAPEDPDKNRWNTTINTDCTCLIGLKSTQMVAESNPDALAQIWAAIDELKAGGGGSGTPGKDGREIEIQNNGTAIQWRYVGDDEWADLVQLSDLKGEGIPEGGTTGQVLTKNSDSDGDVSWKNPSTVSDEQVKTAVDNYLEENPVQGGITEEQKQQLEQNTQDITDLKSALPDKLDTNQGVENKGKAMMVGDDGILFPSNINGVSTKLKNAILNCFSNVAWSNENGQVYYNELKEALELVKTMSLLYEGKNATVKGERIYSDLGVTLIGESGTRHGRVFASDIFKEDTTAKVTLIPSVNCYNPSYIGISKIDEWTLETTTSSTAYMYNAIKFSRMTVDMEYTATINVEPGYQVVFLIGGTNTVEPEIEVVGAVEE